MTVMGEKWLLPDGVDELFPPHARRLELLRRAILDYYHSFGYEMVYPAMMEHLESLSVGAGKDVALQTFKVTDQLTGRQLGIRADTTPQVARIAARLGAAGNMAPCRLCYSAPVLHATPSHLLASRTQLQIGAEVYGHNGLESDLEILSIMMETLTLSLSHDEADACAMPQVTVGLGHVGIMEGLLEGLELTDDESAQLESIFRRKAVPELAAFVAAKQKQTQDQGRFEQLALLNVLIHLHGSESVLNDAVSSFSSAPTKVLESIDYLRQAGTQLKSRYPELSIYYDLSDFRGYHYHTGLVFAAYIEGLSDPIAQGGRYNGIGREFGFARAATGYSMDLLQIVKTINMTDVNGEKETLIYAPLNAPSEVVAELRHQGSRVVCGLTENANEKLSLKCSHQLVEQETGWSVESC